MPRYGPAHETGDCAHPGTAQSTKKARETASLRLALAKNSRGFETAWPRTIGDPLCSNEADARLQSAEQNSPLTRCDPAIVSRDFS
jgi:hypothetical protein